MDSSNICDRLEKQIEETETLLRELKSQLREARLRASGTSEVTSGLAFEDSESIPGEDLSSFAAQLHIDQPNDASKWPLELDEYQRYGRQMIVSNIGIQGQPHWNAILLTSCSYFKQVNYVSRDRLSLL